MLNETRSMNENDGMEMDETGSMNENDGMEMSSVPKGREFCVLLSIFVKSLATSNPPAVLRLEKCVLPLLDRLDFVWKCEDLRALRTVIDSLKLAGLQLPFETRKALACELFRRVLSCKSSISVARDHVDFAKLIVDDNFYAVVDAIDEALPSAVINENHGITSSDYMLAIIEEEVCWYICDDSRLFEYVFEETFVENRNGRCCRIRMLLQKALQSQDSEFRLQVLRVAAACSFNSISSFSKLAPILETAIYLEDFEAREYILAVFMDVIYLHHHALNFEEIEQFLVPFLYSPTANMQYAVVVGIGRLLLNECFPEETENLLSAMIERYVYPIPLQCSSLNESLEPVLKAMHVFFETYSGAKDSHQDEIANTIAFMCIKKLDEEILSIDKTKNVLHDSPNKRKEANNLRLAMKFGFSLSTDITETVMCSIAVNINARLGDSILRKEDCFNWFLSN